MRSTKYDKKGSIYTDMIKPLEKQLYAQVLQLEDERRASLDEKFPHQKNLCYEDYLLEDLKELRSIVPITAKIVIEICLWKDVTVWHKDAHSLYRIQGSNPFSSYAKLYFHAIGLQKDFTIAVSPTCLEWDDNYEVEWSLVVKGEMTIDAFVELLKNKSQGRIPWISDVPELQQLTCDWSIRQKDFREAYKKFKGEREIEPYNRSNHGDEIDMLMDDKGTTQRFKIGEDGQPIFPKSEAKGTGADGVTEGFMTFVQNTNVMVRRLASARASSIIDRIGMSPTELCALLARGHRYQLTELVRKKIISSEEHHQIYDAMHLLKNWTVISPVTGYFLGNVDAPFEKALQVAIASESLTIRD